MFNQNSDPKYAGSLSRFFANTIDILIANIIRMIVFSILGNLLIKKNIATFWIDFKDKFNSNFIGNNPERIRFLVEHQIFKIILISLLLVFISGTLYYILFNCSKWQATIGKRLMKIIIVKDDNQRLTLMESTSHYLLSIVPWFFVFYIFAYQVIHKTSIYEAISGNVFNLIFGLVTLAWLQINLITKKRTTAADLICKTIVINKITNNY